MVDVRTGGEFGVGNSSRDNLVRGNSFGIGNVRTLTAAAGSDLYRATALKEGMLGGVRSTDTTIADQVGGAWQVVYNYSLLEGGGIEVVPIQSGGCYYVEVL